MNISNIDIIRQANQQISKPVAETDIFLMPSYDEFTLGYSDRRALIESTNKSKVNTKNLIFSPIIISNGKVIE